MAPLDARIKNGKHFQRSTPVDTNSDALPFSPEQTNFLTAIAKVFFSKKEPQRTKVAEPKLYSSWFDAPSANGMNKLFSAENAWVLNKIRSTYQTTALPNVANKKFRVSTFEKGEKAKIQREDSAYVLAWAMKRFHHDKHVSKRLLEETMQRAETNRSQPVQVSLLADVKTNKGETKKVSLQSFYDTYPHMIKGIETIFGVQLSGQDNTSTITLIKQRNKKPELRMHQALFVLRRLIERSYEKPQLNLKDLLKTAYGVTLNDTNNYGIQKNITKLKATGLPEVKINKPPEIGAIRSFINKAEEEKEIRYAAPRVTKKEIRDPDKIKQAAETLRQNFVAQMAPQIAKRNKSVVPQEAKPVFFKPQPALIVNGLVIGDDTSRLLSYNEYPDQKLVCVDYTMVAAELRRNPEKILNADFLKRTDDYLEAPYDASKVYDNVHRELFSFDQLQTLYFNKEIYKPAITVRYTKDTSKPDAAPVMSIHHSLAKIDDMISFKLANHYLDPDTKIISEHVPAYYKLHPLQNFYVDNKIVPDTKKRKFQVLQQNLSNDARAKTRTMLFQNEVDALVSVDKADFNKKETYEAYVGVMSSSEAFDRSIPDEACRLPLQVDTGAGALNSGIAYHFLQTGRKLLNPEVCTRLAQIHALQRHLRIKSEHMINTHIVRTVDKHGKATDDAKTAFIMNDIQRRHEEHNRKQEEQAAKNIADFADPSPV